MKNKMQDSKRSPVSFTLDEVISATRDLEKIMRNYGWEDCPMCGYSPRRMIDFLVLIDSEISKAKGEVLKEVKNRFGGSVLLEASGGKIVKKTPPLDSWLQSELDKLSKKNKCSGK